MHGRKISDVKTNCWKYYNKQENKMKQIAWKNTLLTKVEAIKQAKAHRLADEFQQMGWWDGEKGCSLGCMFNKYTDENWYEIAHERTGIPLDLVCLQEVMFEGLSKADSEFWTEDFYKAVPEHVDLSLVIPKLMVWLMEDVKQYAKDFPEVLALINRVQELHQRTVGGENVTKKQWEDVRLAAANPAANPAIKAAIKAAYAGIPAAINAAYAAIPAAKASAKAAGKALFYKRTGNKLLEILQQTGE